MGENPPDRRRAVAFAVLAFPVAVGAATIGISDGWLGPDPVLLEGVGAVPALGRPDLRLDGLVELATPGRYRRWRWRWR